jgi:hypothetical protein
VAKKKTAARSKRAKGSRKAASARKRSARTAPSGGGSQSVNLTPLKKQLAAHIERLQRYDDPTGKIKETIETLSKTRTFLGSVCGTSMVLPTR